MKKVKEKPLLTLKDAKKLEKEYTKWLQTTDFFKKNFMGGAVFGLVKKRGK